jgi:hypothetical protein
MLIRKLLSRRPWSWDLLYWLLFAAILSVGMAYRAFWTYLLAVPFVAPDSAGYLQAAILYPWAPFTEVRTAGAPLLFLIGASSVFDPVGILLAHHALWLTSSAALANAIRKHLGLLSLSLLILVYLTFNAKAISFEYYVLSEHLSRVMYAFYAAAAIATWRRPASKYLAGLIAVLVFINILAKPSAIILLPATIILYAAHTWRLRRVEPRRILSTGFLSIALALTLILSYSTWFKVRYGSFALSHFEGYNLFSHVGHLIDLDGPAYPELKRDLAPIMTVYRDKYVARGTLEPNWLVYGSVNQELKNDFGDVSPASLIVAYVRRTKGHIDLAAVNKIFLDLAIEGIRAHPLDYLKYVWASFYRLFHDGYGFIYYQYLPSPATLDIHRASTKELHSMLFAIVGVTPAPACEASRQIAQRATWPLRPFLGKATLDCEPLPYDASGISDVTTQVHGWFVDVAKPIQALLRALPIWAASLAIFLIWPHWLTARARKIAFYALFFGICTVAYGALLALLNISEVARFTVNIQDCLVLAMGLVIAGVLVSCRQALLRLTYMRALPRVANRVKTSSPLG